MRPRTRNLALLACLTALLAGCSSSTSRTSSTSTSHSTPTANLGVAEDAYLSAQAATGAFRGSVLVARGSTVLLDKGYGPADEKQSAINTPTTRFRIGSLTKQFTALAILILQERGKLQVTDSVCLYVPNCPADWQPVTLRHLLTHTSGIPDYLGFADFPVLSDEPATPTELVARFKDMPLNFTPGTRWSYSSSGYVLLGYIIEQVTGETYAQFLQANIFDPLQMRNTGYNYNSPSPPQYATGYIRPHAEAGSLDMSEFYADGALYSTVEDLYTWDRALAAGKLVTRQTLDAMFAPQVPCPKGGCAMRTDTGDGYGWFVGKASGDTLLYHAGHVDGFLTFNSIYSTTGVDVIVLGNMDSDDTVGIALHLGAMVLGK